MESSKQEQSFQQENFNVEIVKVEPCTLLFKLEAGDMIRAPDESLLNQQYHNFLQTLDINPDKQRVLKDLDNSKKWEILCTRKYVEPKHHPEYYISRIRETTRSLLLKKICIPSPIDMKQVLQDLEVALRTYPISWMGNFLGDRLKALNVLGSYMHPQLPRNAVVTRNNAMKPSDENLFLILKCIQNIISCREGMDKVINHKKLVKKVTLSLRGGAPKCRILALQVLRTICEVPAGHDCVLNSFQILQEKKRFSILTRIMKNEKLEDSLRAACLEFIYTIVHSPDNRNYQVSLQHEFQLLNLGESLDAIVASKESMIPELVNVVERYLKYSVDIQTLMEAVEVRDKALHRFSELKSDLNFAMDNVVQVH